MKFAFVADTGMDEQSGVRTVLKRPTCVLARGGGTSGAEPAAATRVLPGAEDRAGRFYYWRRALALETGAGDAAGHFALVRRVANRAEPSRGGLELEVMRGWRLRIPPDVSAASLRTVLAALAAQT